ncbi:PQQ-binding-like beta-propeller repeat protein [Enterobacteriaceae endosymbiont of Donacia bicoloricornis]|uniref:outer membrane protein assembly factor BamB family protein n=1 Tax=Enterobacteriaceae endosymbiont of Donacia bicoloricornis TaxID=2675772 RepID=UPI001449E10F|nr:PQQ-binding-like beta-propeller repeat protein [Enterobacteriaceae endosymbiont of Donacia bicoloricornis]QJC37582.1 PQQ-binding-like beta-propeller repeat protein [Enterobacteriaceae endosymbiont of Donacia bicoloricornis]
MKIKLSKLMILIFIFCSICLTSCTYEKDSFFHKKNNSLSKLDKIKLKLIWQNKIGKNNIILNKLNPFYYKGFLYLANSNGYICCINVKTGKIIWHINLINRYCFFSSCKYEYITSGPIISNNYLYVGNKQGKIFAINIKTKSIVWTQNVFSEILSNFVIRKNILVVNSIGNILQGLNKNNGKILWTVNLGDFNTFAIRGLSTPVLFFDNIITGSDNGLISSRIVSNGSLVWEQNLLRFSDTNNFIDINDIDVQPVIYNEVVYATSYNGTFTALNLSTGDVIWEKIYFTHKNFIVDKNNIYLIDSKNRILALNALNGNLIWKQDQFKNNKIDNLFIYKKKIFFTNNKGFLYWIDPKKGFLLGNKRIDKYKINFILLIKNKLIIQTLYNKIYLFKILIT